MHLTDKHGRTYVVTSHDELLEREYRVYDGRKCIAVAELPYANARYVSNVFVSRDYRRRGIASALYDLIEQTRGIELRPSHLLLADGELFWLARDASKVSSSVVIGNEEPSHADILAFR